MFLRSPEQDDAAVIALRDGDDLTAQDLFDDPPSFFRTVCAEDGDVLGVFGVHEIASGTCLFRAIVTDKARGKGVALTKLARQFINDMEWAFRMRKAYVEVRSDREEYKRWVELLGFRYEYTMLDAVAEGVHLMGYAKWVGQARQ